VTLLSIDNYLFPLYSSSIYAELELHGDCGYIFLVVAKDAFPEVGDH
jgi:hypothetical protein